MIKKFFIAVVALLLGATALFAEGVQKITSETYSNYSSYGIDESNYSLYDGYFAITSASELLAFADSVKAGKTSSNAVMLADVVLNENVVKADYSGKNDGTFDSWTPIGSSSNKYAGIFDGNGHSINGLYHNEYTEYFGMFLYTSETAVIRNLQLKDSYIYANDYNGSLVVYNYGTIENCSFDGYMNLDDYDGGLVCYNYGIIQNSFYHGCFKGYSNSSTAAICYSNRSGATISNCYVFATISYAQGSAICTNNDGIIENCYYNNELAQNDGVYSNDGTADVTGKSTADFESGLVCFLLNGSASEEPLTWGQRIGVDDKPIFMLGSSQIVYFDSEATPQYYNTACVMHKSVHVASVDATCASYGYSEHYECVYCKSLFIDAACTLSTTKESLQLEKIDHNFDKNGFCTVCGEISPASLVDGVYQIVNLGNLLWFSDMVNAGNAGINAKLIADIVLNENVVKSDYSGRNAGTFTQWQSIGCDTNRYAGVFDGNGHSISGLYYNTSKSYYGMFSYTSETAVIKNLRIVDSYISNGSDYVGGIVAYNRGRIEQCSFDGYMYTDDYNGGICVYNEGVVTNCSYSGYLYGYGSSTGGICYTNKSGATVSNCYVNATIPSGKGSAICSNNSGTVSNCYYNQTLCTSLSGEQKGVEGKTTEQFASGLVCYLLNGSTSEGDIVWKHTIGTDTYPVYVGGTVYPSSPCPAELSNDATSNKILEHSYVDGVCENCDAVHIPELVDGYYEISNKGELNWFVSAVNKGANTLNAKLIADIVLNENVVKSDYSGKNDGTFTQWQSIGCDTNRYAGIFDGNGHSISGLYYNDYTDYFGMFLYTSETAVVRNLQLKDSYIYAHYYNGGLVVYNYGTIEQCSFNGYMYTYDYNGGICAYNEGVVTNCSYSGYLYGYYGSSTCGICYANKSGATVSNCYVNATIPSYKGSAICSNNSGTVRNCYYNQTLCTYLSGVQTSVEGKTTEQFATGEVCYLLNLYESEGDLFWFQTIGVDTVPQFTGSVVYASAPCVSMYLNNKDEGTILEHNYVDGVCTACGKEEVAPELVHGYYEIATVSDLNWFVSKVNNGDVSINARLIADIVINENVLNEDKTGVNEGEFVQWTPIGSSSYRYSGIFDGNGHVISGVYYNSNSDDAGLFRYIGTSAVITNLHFTDLYMKNTNAYGGGLAYYNYGKISKCSIDGRMELTSYIGGYCCYNYGTIENSYYNGSFDGATYNGVFCYENGSSGIISSCYSNAVIVGKYDGMAIAYRNSGTIENCYYNSDLSVNTGLYPGDSPGVKGHKTSDFESGRVCFLLNGSTSGDDVVWRQTLGVDAIPQLKGDIIYVSSPCWAVVSNNPENVTTLEHNLVDGICSQCGESVPPELVDGYYEISNLRELYWFVSAVNNGGDTLNAKLIADIVINENVVKADYSGKNDGTFTSWKPIGSSSNKYAGIFDGNGHSINGLYHNEYTYYFGMFLYTSETAVIRNLQLKDSYIYADDYNGGLVVYNYGTIENCSFDGYMYTDDANGGLVYNNYGTGTIQNSFYHGYFRGYSNSGAAGLCYSNKENAIISNCYVAATIPSGRGSSICGFNSGTIDNSYYNNELAQNGGLYSGAADIIGKSTIDFESGRVCFLLNGSTSGDDVVWRQTLDVDAIPQLKGDIVYVSSPCLGVVSNNPENVTTLEHDFVNGICSQCGESVIPELVDGYYEISNLGELYWFVSAVSKGADTLNAKLIADIVINENVVKADYSGKNDGTFTSWKPIGSSSNKYAGIFDGNGHSINGLYHNEYTNYFGMFLYTSETAVIRNLQLKDSYIYADDYNGGLVVYNYGTIENCSFDGYMSTGDCNGGLVYNNYGTIQNSFYHGYFRGYSNSNAAGICYLNKENATISNCYVSVTIPSGRGSAVCSYNKGTIKNSYYNNEQTQNVGVCFGSLEVTGKSTADFESGRVCFLLNGSTSGDDVVWKQTLGVDAIPQFTGDVVYASMPCFSVVSNSPESAITLEHNFVDRICSQCGEHAIPELVDGYYEISDLVELYWFVSAVNNGGDTLNAKLIADIVINENVVKADYSGKNDGTFTSWTPIGSSSNKYAGIFDGNGHSISGLYHDFSTSYFGMFSYTSATAVIRNLQLKDSYIYADDYNGGLVVYNYGTIENCSFDGYMFTDDYNGGLVYNNYGTIQNSFYHGYFRGYSNSNAAGICYSNKENATISNCYVSATIPSGKGYAVCCYNSGTIDNSYYNDELAQNGGLYSGTADVTGKSTYDFESGKVCYLLNGSTSEGDLIWGQRLAVDSCPIFWTSASQTVHYNNDESNPNYYNESCIHKSEFVAEVSSNCLVNGVAQYYVCSYCKILFLDAECTTAITIEELELPLGDHTEVVDSAVAATCTKTGLTVGSHCSVCNVVLVAQEKIAALGHTEVVDEAVAATCTETGLTAGSHCSVCNEVFVAQEEVAALGHTEVVDAEGTVTCTEPGFSKGSHCSVCNAILVEQKEIPALGHTEIVDSAVAATCTVAGKTEGKHCSVCNEVLVAQEEVAALGHVEVVDSTVAATCTETGLTEGSHCSRCSEVFVAQEEIAALGHTEVVDEGVAATCTETGKTEGKHCSVCNEVLLAQEEVAALGHTEVVDEGVAATCTKTGKTEGKHCSVCNEVLVAQEEVAALGHTEVVDEAVSATCTTAGKTEGKHCSVCNEVLVAQEEIAALGHTEVVDAAVEATCTESGKTEGKHCSVCNEVLVAQEVIPASHTEVIDKEGTVTCTEAGLSRGSHCSVCGIVLVVQAETPALGHDEVVDEAVAATCTETGLTEGKHCSRCNEVLVAQEEVAALGHTEVVDEAVAATCTAAGKTAGKHCSVCNEVLVAQEVVEAKGHIEVVDEAVAATCTEAGKTAGSHCSVCSEVLVAQETTEALGHDEVIDEAVLPTMTETGLTEGSHCSRCNEVLVAQEVIPVLTPATVSKVELTVEPTKLEYKVGEELDLVGAQVTITYSDSTTRTIDLTPEMVSGFDNQVAGTQIITIVYEFVNTSFEITVVPAEPTAVEDVEAEIQIYAYTRTIVVEVPSVSANEIVIYRIDGRIVSRTIITSNRNEIEVAQPGVYLVQVGTKIEKVVVQ